MKLHCNKNDTLFISHFIDPLSTDDHLATGIPPATVSGERIGSRAFIARGGHSYTVLYLSRSIYT